jgi:hypothetical protein
MVTYAGTLLEATKDIKAVMQAWKPETVVYCWEELPKGIDGFWY